MAAMMMGMPRHLNGDGSDVASMLTFEKIAQLMLVMLLPLLLATIT